VAAFARIGQGQSVSRPPKSLAAPVQTSFYLENTLGGVASMTANAQLQA
jgi:hypothetical protein